MPDSFVVFAVLTAVGLAGLLAAEYTGSRLWRWIAKPLASTGFVLAALTAGALSSRYGRAVLVALVLSWLGDVLLIPRSARSFKAGLFAFLLGHVAFAVAFVVAGVSPLWTLCAVALVGAPAFLVARWLVPKVQPERLRGPVVAYIVVISAMVVLAVGTVGAGTTAAVLVAALLFYASDVSVAVNRFVDNGFANRAFGLPAYYGAQLVFAWTILTIASP